MTFIGAAGIVLVREQKNKRTLLLLSILMLFFLTLSRPAYAGEDMTFGQTAKDAGDEVIQVLIKKGICESPRKKCMGHVFAVNPFKAGFEFSTYGIVEARTLEEVRIILQRKFYATPQMKHLIFSAFRGKTTSTGKFIRRVGLIHQIEFKREV